MIHTLFSRIVPNFFFVAKSNFISIFTKFKDIYENSLYSSDTYQ